MKYQVGDTVLILHSNEEAQVVDIINEKMLMVDVKGVTFPVYMDQVDFPYFKRFTEKNKQPQKKEKRYVDDLRPEKNAAPKEEDGMWLTFLPTMMIDEFGDTIVQELKLHLLNHNQQEFRFRYQLNYFGKEDFSLENSIRPFEDFYLHDIDFANLNDNPTFEFDFSLAIPDRTKAPHHETALRLKPKQLFAKIEELRQKNLATFSHRLFEKYPDRSADVEIGPGARAIPGSMFYDAAEARQRLEPARSVVDLHIEKLADRWQELSNHEILDRQLKTFEKFFFLALAHHLPSMIVIHGVGEGVLRDEIHDWLRLQKDVKSFVNQYDPRFGFGATEIYFQY